MILQDGIAITCLQLFVAEPIPLSNSTLSNKNSISIFIPYLAPFQLDSQNISKVCSILFAWAKLPVDFIVNRIEEIILVLTPYWAVSPFAVG